MLNESGNFFIIIIFFYCGIKAIYTKGYSFHEHSLQLIQRQADDLPMCAAVPTSRFA